MREEEKENQKRKNWWHQVVLYSIRLRAFLFRVLFLCFLFLFFLCQKRYIKSVLLMLHAFRVFLYYYISCLISALSYAEISIFRPRMCRRLQQYNSIHCNMRNSIFQALERFHSDIYSRPHLETHFKRLSNVRRDKVFRFCHFLSLNSVKHHYPRNVELCY